MAKRSQLFLYEEIMLLALRDEQGTVATQYPTQVIAGAVMAELLLDGRVGVDGGRKQWVDVKNAAAVGDPVIDECLSMIGSSPRRRSLKGWLERLSNVKKLTQKVARQLVDRGIVRAEQDKVLFIFTRNVYPQVNPLPERKIVERLRDAVFSDSSALPARTAVLVALADAAGLLGGTFGRGEVRQRRKRIAGIVSGSATGRATKEIIEAQQAAVMAAAIMPAIIAGGASH